MDPRICDAKAARQVISWMRLCSDAGLNVASA